MYTKNENIVARSIHGSNYLIDITQNYVDEKSSLYEINDIGMFVWRCIDGKSDASEITKRLIAQLTDEVPYDVVYEDIIDFIKTLHKQGFIIEGSSNT